MDSTAMLKPLLACCLLLALSACGDEPSTAQASSSASDEPATHRASPPAPSRADDDAAATPERPKGAPEAGSCAQVVGGVDLCSDHSGPAFALRWTSDDGATWRSESFDVRGYLLDPITSAAPGVLTAVGGGDGATLLPFELALRSDDLGATWERIELPRFDGQRAYVAGSVVTSDGRLLSLLNQFSDDGPGWEADRQHGLYASDGSNWSSYSQVLPEFSPVLRPTPPGESGLQELTVTVGAKPVIRVRTWDDRVYVSTDDATSFHQVRRP